MTVSAKLEDYEKLPRKTKFWSDQAKKLSELPVILSDGISLNPSHIKKKIIFAAKKKLKVSKTIDKINNIRIKQDEKNKLNTRKWNKKLLPLITKISQLLVEDPESNIKLMAQLFEYINLKPVNFEKLSLNERNYQICSVALLSAAFVFKNSLTGARIVDIDSTKVNRKTALQRNVESTLQNYYCAFLKVLQSRFYLQPSLILSIYGEHLFSSPSLIFNETLISECVKFLGLNINKLTNIDDPEVLAAAMSSKSCSILSELINMDATFDSTSKIVDCIYKSIKSSSNKRYFLNPNTFILLQNINFVNRAEGINREIAVSGLNSSIKTNVEREIELSSIYGNVKRFESTKTEIVTKILEIVLIVLNSPMLVEFEVLSNVLIVLENIFAFIPSSFRCEVMHLVRSFAIKFSNQIDCSLLLVIVDFFLRLIENINNPFTEDLQWVYDILIKILLKLLPKFNLFTDNHKFLSDKMFLKHFNMELNDSNPIPEVDLFLKCISRLATQSSENHPVKSLILAILKHAAQIVLPSTRINLAYAISTLCNRTNFCFRESMDFDNRCDFTQFLWLNNLMNCQEHTEASVKFVFS